MAPGKFIPLKCRLFSQPRPVNSVPAFLVEGGLGAAVPALGLLRNQGDDRHASLVTPRRRSRWASVVSALSDAQGAEKVLL